MRLGALAQAVRPGPIVKKIALAVVAGLVGALLSLFAEEIHAYFSYLFVGGNLGGDYVLRTFVYDDGRAAWVPYTTNLNLKHGGTRVFGTNSSTTSNQRWSLFGYFRSPFLALAYENRDPAAHGTGTYTLKQDLPYVFWGHWIGVECDLNINQRFLAQCPCIAYRSDHPEMEQRYSKFMERECVRITLEGPGPCPQRKTTKVPSS